MQVDAIEKPLGKWYYRFERTGILFPTFFESYYSIEGIVNMDFVYDDKLGIVEIQKIGDDFGVFENELHCKNTFIMEQFDRGHCMEHWDLSNHYHRQLFNMFIEKYITKILNNPYSKTNMIYAEMERELKSYEEKK